MRMQSDGLPIKENTVKNEIKRVLARYKTYWHMPVQNGMGAPSLDFICCHRGYYIGIEAKAPGKKPTARQLATMGQILGAGGIAVSVSNDEELKHLEQLLYRLGKPYRDPT